MRAGIGMEPLYENTPFERIALWTPLIGICFVIAALLLFLRLTALSARQTAEPGDRTPSVETWRTFSLRLGAVGVALTYLGLVFVLRWRDAHAAYPTRFGIALLVAASCVVVMVPFSYRIRGTAWMAGLTFWSVVVAVAIVAVVAAFSHSIIAEGQVTAMVLPLALAIAVAVALATGAIVAFIIRRTDPWSMMNAVALFAFLMLAYATSSLLPVVQFRADGSVFPVNGAFWVVSAGVIAATIPAMVRIHRSTIGWGSIAIAFGVGYWLAAWYGIALALLGVIAGWILRDGITSSPAPHRTV